MKTSFPAADFVGSLSGAALLQGTGLGRCASHAALRSATLSAEPLAEGLICIQRRRRQCASRCGMQAGLVFIDGGAQGAWPGAAAEARAAAAAASGRCTRSINTHWHPEHTGLNEHAGKQGAKIIAHENTRCGFRPRCATQPDGPPIPAAARGRTAQCHHLHHRRAQGRRRNTALRLPARRPTPMATCT